MGTSRETRGRARGRVRLHSAFGPPRQRLRAPFSSHRAHPRRQADGRDRHPRAGGRVVRALLRRPNGRDPLGRGPDMKVTFMGTAGARFMVAKQLAASGGLYLEDGGARLSLDPGPGAIVQYATRKVDLTKLDAIILSHRHLDHAGDVNVMVEAMTDGGFRHRGRLFCPADALDN